MTASSSADDVGQRPRDADGARELDALAESEQRHRELFESSGAAQLILDDSRGEILDANPSAEAFYGWPRATLRSMRISDIEDMPFEQWRDAVFRLDAQRADGAVHRHRVSPGGQREVEIMAGITRFDGRPALHLVVHDVSDRLRTVSLLRDRDDQLLAVINAMSEGVVVHDACGSVLAHNPSAERILGLKADEVRSLHPGRDALDTVHEDGRAWPAVDFPGMLALRTASDQPRSVMGIRRPGRDDQWLEVSANPLIRSGEVKPYAAVAVFSDVTNSRHAEERNRQAQRLEVVGQLAAGIAHDFNNLLTVMRGSADLLAEALGENSDVADDVQVLLRATDRAEELTRQLLAFGRRQMLRAAAIDLNVLVGQELTHIRDGAPPSIQVETALPHDKVIGRLDPRLAVEAIHALVDNAKAAMPNGGTLTLTTALRTRARATAPESTTEQTFAMLEVRDTGVGMSDAVRARVFEPFYSTRPFGANHGMGLASVHGMVAQSHGFVEIDSAPDAGTAVRLYFPCATGQERLITPQDGITSVQSRHILLVDDDELLRALIAKMLERLGHSVAVADSAETALDMLAREPGLISVMITDLTMPGMGGMELIARTAVEHPDLPMVAISGFAVDSSVREELSRRRVGFLPKPFQFADLAGVIDRVRSSSGASLAT